MPIGLVIFDCDGVLVDSELIACRAVSQCLAESGIHLSIAEVNDRYMGVSDVTMHKDLRNKFGAALPEDFLNLLSSRIAQNFRQQLKPVEGVPEMLRALPYPACVASSSAPERIERSLKLTGLIDFFGAHLFSAFQVQQGKPAPDLFLFAAAQMQVQPERCVVVEDAVPGIRAACFARMTALGFYGASHCPAGHEVSLLRAGAPAVFSNMKDLLPTLAHFAG
jgi:HAD superfamily hydrolase (TIGR01509 family)